MKKILLLSFIISMLGSSLQAQFTSTPNLGLKKPNGGLTSGWDAYLNGDLDLIDQGRPFSCASQTGADDAAKLVTCMSVAKNSNTAGAVLDGTALTGGSWATNPFDAAGANLPFSGLLLVRCGTTSIKYGPIVIPTFWSMQGCTPTFGNGGYGTVLQAAATYPNGGTGQYTTGTVTMGTPGTSEIITGSGTTWTDNIATAGSGTIAKGCLFLSPATQPVAANSTFGIINSITDTTHIVLGFGVNNGTGAPGGSSYIIYCPLIVMGDGVVSGQAEYSMVVKDMELDANNITGVIPLVNWFAQQSSYASNDSLRNFCGVGLDMEGQFFYQSGPYHHITLNPGTCNDGTSPLVVVRPNGSSFYGLQNIGVFKSGATANPTTGIDLENFGTIEVTGVDSEGPANGVTVGGLYACKPACVQAQRSGLRLVANIDNVFQSLNTSAVHLSNASGINPNVILSNINGAGATNTLVDDNNSCTIPTSSEGRLGSYQTDSNGIVNYSTSHVTGCFPPIPATYSFFCTGTATASSSIIPFPFNSTGAIPCTATASLGGSFPLANSCTLKNLAVHAVTGGVTGDTVTIVNNGGNTSIVAAIGTGTFAQDTTHTSAYVGGAGNGIRVVITTGVASTLANVSGTFQCN